MGKQTITVLLWALLACVAPLQSSDFDVILNEINFNPLSGDDDDEFVELYNRGATAVDISGWSFSEGIVFTIPDGIVIPPRSFLVISPNVEETRGRHGLEGSIVGDYTGVLDNDGEIITLRNVRGALISRAHFNDTGNWPGRTDGRGPTLELIDPFTQADLADNWAASALVHGTPGAPNSALATSDSNLENDSVLIASGDAWRYRRGIQAYPDGWNEAGFNDVSWESGPTGIGYGDGDDATILDDMPGNYTSFAARATFSLTQEEIDGIGALSLRVNVDDGHVGWLNGTEAARLNLGFTQSTVPFNALADDSHEATGFDDFIVSKNLLQPGTNVLAFQVHNRDINSSDASFIATLTALPVLSTPEVFNKFPVVFNEIGPTQDDAAGFLELYNESATTAELGGFEIFDSTGNRFVIPDGVTVPAGNFVVFSDTTLGFPTRIDRVPYVLVEPDGKTYSTSSNPRPAPIGETGFSFGRFPDGNDDTFVMETPTPGAPNSVDISDAIVINEISYHPPFIPPTEGCIRDCSDFDQWIELHNKSAEIVDLSGWRVSNAVRFSFPDGTQIPTGGYLVVTRSPTRFRSSYPEVPVDQVFGPWARALAHDSETINLRDALGNRVDRVEYSDGNPRNDEDPENGVDDGTFVSSEWPHEADDGTGRTLELINPGLDNRLGGAWHAGSIGGTPGSKNASFEPSPDAVIDDVEHFPPIPTPFDDVIVTCRVSAVDPITIVRALWRRDGHGGTGQVRLVDDGLGPDSRANDGKYTGVIPAQTSKTIIAFQIDADIEDGRKTVSPRSPDTPPYNGFNGPFYLYQVFDFVPANGSQSYYIIMTGEDQGALEGRSPQSNVLLYGTFIGMDADGDTRVRHLSGIRYRGSHNRTSNPRSYRVEFRPGHRFKGMGKINLNSQNIENELLGSDLFQRADIPAPQVWAVNLTFQGSTNNRYVYKEHLGSEFLQRYFGNGSDDGNFYRGLARDELRLEADLAYLGENPDPYRPTYDKRTNQEADDFTDLVELFRSFDSVQTSAEEFPVLIADLIDLQEWARWFGVQSCLTNIDGGIQVNRGDDFFLYRVNADSNRPDAGKWIVIPWDLEEIFTNANEPLFRPQLPPVRRFLTHQLFAPLYYSGLVDLRDGVFSRREMRQRFRLIDSLFGFATIDPIDSYVATRVGFYDENIPEELSSGVARASQDNIVGNLVRAGTNWRYFEGRSEPSGNTTAWTQIGFDDSGWLEGPSGFGYDDGDDATLLRNMRNNYQTLYIRKTFELQDASSVASLILSIDYDDGCIAYLNGVEVARRNVRGVRGTRLRFNGGAAGPHEAGEPDVLNISGFVNELRDGTNVLAVQGANHDIASSDFSLIPALGSTALGAGENLGCGELLYTTSDSITLEGRADAGETSSVSVNGQEISYDAFLASWVATVPVTLGETTVTIQSRDSLGNMLESLDVSVMRLPEGLTEIGGALSTNTILTASGGPYHMREDLHVPAGSTLTIQPGTVIVGAESADIRVDGRLHALGTEAEPILFRAETCSGRWGGIVLEGTSTHTLRHCDFEFGDNPVGGGGFVAPIGSNVVIEHCSFRQIAANAINASSGAHVEVRDCSFDTIREGVHTLNSSAVIVDCIFDGMLGDRDGVDFDGDGPQRSIIERCVFQNGADDGIDIGRSSALIRDNFFVNLHDKAISVEGGEPTLTGNVIFNCGTAMALKNGVVVSEAHHNTIVGNQEGISLFAKAGSAQGGHGIFHSLIVWANTVDIKTDRRSTATFTFSNISDEVWPGVGNISDDPLFVDVRGMDFALESGSPAIGTGQKGTDMGAVTFSGPSGPFIRGDVNGDGKLNITDVIRTLTALFGGGNLPACQDRVDANDDGKLDISDAIRSLLFQFSGAPPLPEPFPEEGADPTNDDLVCP